MVILTQPTAVLSHLYRTDGSATFSHNGYAIIASVNGPIEVQRKEELPEEATINVIVRPAAGVGGTRERHLESIIEKTLRQIILIENFPRSLIQITLQITNTPENEWTHSTLNQAAANLPILPALLQASTLALLSAATPLSGTLASTIFALSSSSPKNIIENPTLREIELASSVHVFAFTSHGKLVLNESEGSFSIDDWEVYYDHAKVLCLGGAITQDVDAMQQDIISEGEASRLIKSALKEKVQDDLYWKG